MRPRIAWTLVACALLASPSGAPARGGRGHSSGAAPPGPSIGKVEPHSGPSAGGTRITITGFNLAAGAIVKVGGVAATSVELIARGKLVAVTGPHLPGRVSVSVRNPDGGEGTRGWSFRYVAAEPER